MAVLLVEKGKQAGARFGVPEDASPTVMGRDPSADIVLDDERASRQHASLRRRRGEWVVEDLGSRNGILFRGRPTRQASLKDGEAFQIGSTLLRLREGELLDPLVGKEVQGARLLEILGDDGGVLSYRAQQLAMDRPVRVDIVHPRRKLASLLEPLRLAAEAAARIQHPGVIPLIRAEFEEETGSTLSRWTDAPPLSPDGQEVLGLLFPVRLRFFRKLAEALLARSADPLAYPIGFRHIRVDPEAGPLVAALELSALVALLKGQAADLQAFPGYLPPEQAVPEGTPSWPALAYNLGALGYHLLTGSPPMGQGTTEEILERHRSLAPAPADLVRPEVPHDLAALLARLLEKDAAARPGSPAEVLQALLKIHPGEAPAAAARPSPPPATRPSPPPPARERRAELPPASAGGVRPSPRRPPAPPPKRGLPLPAQLVLWPLIWAGLFFGGRYLMRAILGHWNP